MRSGLLAIVALVGFCGAAFGQDPAATTLAWRHTDQVWQNTVYVAGVPVDAAEWSCGDEDPLTRCADVLGLVDPYSWTVQTCNADGCAWAVLEDGSPGPAIVWGSLPRRLDVSGNGVVDLGDLGVLLRSFGDGW